MLTNFTTSPSSVLHNRGKGAPNAPDFEVLQDAASLVLSQLRRDEQVPELGEQLKEGRAGAGAHHYFLYPYLTEWGAQFVYQKIVPTPSAIVDRFHTLEFVSMMGLLPEINHAWLSIDSQLFLWQYSGSAASAGQAPFVSYDDLDQVVVCVGLAPPREGIFKEVVKYVLVVATPVEVILLGVTFQNDDLDHGSIHLRTTPFSVSTDNINMVKIVGTKHGRILMAGNDGCLYEIVYDGPVLGVIGSLIGGIHPNKCRKLNHSASVVGSVVPGFLKSLGGLAQPQTELVDLVVDDMRNILYTLSKSGCIDVYDLGYHGEGLALVGTRKNVFKLAQKACENAARDYHSAPEARLFNDGHGFSAVSLHVVPPTESRTVHAVVVNNAGFRFYLSTQTPITRGYYSYYATAKSATNESFSRPADLWLVHVRPPPGPDLWSALSSSSQPHAPDGYAPGYQRQPSSSYEAAQLTIRGDGGAPTAPVAVHSAVYCHGALLLINGADAEPDRVIAVGEDLMGRRQFNTGIWEGKEVQPALREVVCEVGPDSYGIGGKVCAVVEACPLLNDLAAAHIRCLLLASRTPPDNELAQGHSRSLTSNKAASREPPHNVPPAPPLILPYAGRDPGAGLALRNLGEITPLSELSTQLFGLVRQFLCLTSAGVHVMSRLRPIDTLCKILSDGDSAPANVDLFFSSFGREQACAMCFALVSGLPEDAGVVTHASRHIQIGAGQPSNLSENLRLRAVGAAFKYGGVPSIKSPAFTSSGSSPQHSARGTVFGEEFSFSYHHNGLALLLARILRPLWFKKLFITDKSGSMSVQFSGNQPVSALFDRVELQILRGPLARFLDLMRKYYNAACVRDCSGTATVNGTPGQGQRVAERVLQLYSSQGQGLMKIKEDEARSREERSLHKIYRLAARAEQALALLDLLLEVQMVTTYVPFHLLIGVTLRDLVVSQDVHYQVQHLLGLILQPSPQPPGLAVDFCEHIAQELSKACGFYFSDGDRLTYEGQRCLSEAMYSHEGSPERWQNEQKGLELLCRAAVFWRSAASVSEDGPLVFAVQSLLALNRLDGLVKLVLTCAQNFIDSSFNRSKWFQLGTSENSDRFGWEVGLYHSGAVNTPEERRESKLACYQQIINILEGLIRPELRIGMGAFTDGARGTSSRVDLVALADKLLRYVPVSHDPEVPESKDPEFHEMVFAFLLANDEQRLLKIHSSYLEDFLRTNCVFELLYKYYVFHNKHSQAAQLMTVLAQNDDSIPLSDRIRFLTRAVTSAKEALGEKSIRAPGSILGTHVHKGENIVELEEQLEVARLQQRILVALQSELHVLHDKQDKFEFEGTDIRAEVIQMSESVAELSVRLIPVSELYNDYASRYRLWKLCLVTLGICSHDDRDVISVLWRALIYNKVPSTSRDASTSAWLQRELNTVERDPYKTEDSSFDEEVWRISLQKAITDLGKELYNSQYPFTFPVPYLCKELEILAAKHDRVRDADPSKWVIEVMTDIGVSFQVLSNIYRDFCTSPEVSSNRTQYLSSFCEVLLVWSESKKESERQEFFDYCSNRNLERKCEEFITDLQGILNRDKATDTCIRKLQDVQCQIQRICY